MATKVVSIAIQLVGSHESTIEGPLFVTTRWLSRKQLGSPSQKRRIVGIDGIVRSYRVVRSSEKGEMMGWLAGLFIDGS